MKQSYIEYIIAAGFFNESTVKSVDSRRASNIDLDEIPRRCFAFRFFDQEETTVKGEVLTGDPKNYSGMYYVDGEIKTVEDLKAHPRKYKTLISNMQTNNWPKVVKCNTGNFQPFNDKKDKIISTKK